MRLPRYRMIMHEKLDFGRYVNACMDDDVKKLEKMIRTAIEDAYREGYSDGYGAGLGDGHPEAEKTSHDVDHDWQYSKAKNRYCNE